MGRPGFLVVAVLVGLLTVGSAALVSAQDRPLDRLELPGVVSYELSLPSYVAQALGYFEDEGIEVTRFVLGSGGTVRAAVMAGQHDFGLFAFVHAPIARLGGSPWKAIVATHNREIFSLVVRSGLKDKVKTVADLKGHTVGFSTPGAGAWYMGLTYLRGAGLDPDRDVNYVSLGGDPGVIYTALQTGRVDAFVSWEPTTTRVIMEGIAYPLVRVWDPDDHRQWVGSEKALSMILVTREDVIDRDPDLVARMVRVHQRALEFIRNHTPQEIARVVMGNPKTAPLFEGLDETFVVEMFSKIHGGFGDGCLSRSGFQTVMDLAVRYGAVPQAVSFEDFAATQWAGECP